MKHFGWEFMEQRWIKISTQRHRLTNDSMHYHDRRLGVITCFVTAML